MKTSKIFKWLLKALVLTTVMGVMQACVDSLFENRRSNNSNNKEDEEETSFSVDLLFSGLHHEDEQYEDDYIHEDDYIP